MRTDASDRSQPPWAMRRFPTAEAAREWASGFEEGHLRLWSHQRCEWPDGGRFAGPWVEVTGEAAT